jgi:hypothetical protein
MAKANMKGFGGSPKAATSIPMGTKKGKLESKHDSKIGPERQGKTTMPGPKSNAHGSANGKGHSKPPMRHYPPASPDGGKAVVTKHGFILNRSYYK